MRGGCATERAVRPRVERRGLSGLEVAADRASTQIALRAGRARTRSDTTRPLTAVDMVPADAFEAALVEVDGNRYGATRLRGGRVVPSQPQAWPAVRESDVRELASPVRVEPDADRETLR